MRFIMFWELQLVTDKFSVNTHLGNNNLTEKFFFKNNQHKYCVLQKLSACWPARKLDRFFVSGQKTEANAALPSVGKHCFPNRDSTRYFQIERSTVECWNTLRWIEVWKYFFQTLWVSNFLPRYFTPFSLYVKLWIKTGILFYIAFLAGVH